jgi:molybdopterin converting factor small subunit
MNIEVKLFFDLAKYLPPEASKSNSVSISLKEGSTIQELIDKLNLPPKMTKVILVNGIKPKNETKLKDGDLVAIFPPMAGG